MGLISASEGVGAPAPPLELPAADGRTRSLAEFRGRPVLLSFLGPAHCTMCRAHVIRMIQARERIAEAGAEVVLVAYHDPELLMSKMLSDLALPYLLLLDLKKQAYVRWGLGQVGVRAFLVPSLYLALAKAAFRPSFPPEPDRGQMGGDFVVDRSGRLAFVNRMRSLHDRAPVPDLLAAAQQA
jgi:peroxiredoxin